MSQEIETRFTLTTFVWLLLGLIIVSAYMVGSLALAIVMGGIVALLSQPMHRFLMRHRLPKRASALLVTIIVLLLVVAPLLTFAALAVCQGIGAYEYFSESERFSITNLVDMIRDFEPAREFLEGDGSSGTLEWRLRSMLETGGKGASLAILSFAKDLPEGLLQLFMAFLTCFYMLVDGPRFIQWISKRLPVTADVRKKIMHTFRDTAIGVIWASMAAALAQALVLFVGFSVLSVPGAFLAGGLTFVLSFVPLVGSTPVVVFGALVLFGRETYGALTIMLIFGAVAGVVDNIIRPWILKGRNEMHPLVSLTAIFGGIATFGVFGVFLGPILAAVVISLLQIWPVIGERYGLHMNQGPPTSPLLDPDVSRRTDRAS